MGQALVYTRSGTSWSLTTTLTASDGAVNDQFGRKAVAIHGNTILVSAHQEIGETAYGKAYAFHLRYEIYFEFQVHNTTDLISIH